MRTPVLVIMTFGAVLATAPAQAQTYDPSYPVCLHVYRLHGGDYMECGYTSLAQCAASASGRAAQCVTNPYFEHAYKEPPGRVYRRHRRVY
jgi:hypothetical protein